MAENQAFAPLKFPHKASGWHFIFDEITEMKVDFVVRVDFEIG
ncbi:MAG: hypothetical protein ONB27_06835 [candidate division KSB1 bacterium]|nr:hypothetical protein [candidate division KSB1 bacterium]